MIRRRLIRGLCITLCSLCAATWIASYVWPVTLNLGFSTFDYVIMPFSNGRIGFVHMNDVAMGPGWFVDCHKGYKVEWPDDAASIHVLGFCYFHPGIARVVPHGAAMVSHGDCGRVAGDYLAADPARSAGHFPWNWWFGGDSTTGTIKGSGLN